MAKKIKVSETETTTATVEFAPKKINIQEALKIVLQDTLPDVAMSLLSKVSAKASTTLIHKHKVGTFTLSIHSAEKSFPEFIDSFCEENQIFPVQTIYKRGTREIEKQVLGGESEGQPFDFNINPEKTSISLVIDEKGAFYRKSEDEVFALFGLICDMETCCEDIKYHIVTEIAETSMKINFNLIDVTSAKYSAVVSALARVFCKNTIDGINAVCEFGSLFEQNGQSLGVFTINVKM